MNPGAPALPHDLTNLTTLVYALAVGFALGGITIGVFALRLRRAERLAGTGHRTLIQRLGEARGKPTTAATSLAPIPESRR